MAKLRKTLTPEELERELAKVDEETLEFFKQAIAEKQELVEKLRKNDATRDLLGAAEALYRDIVSDKIIRVDGELFTEGAIAELYKSQQAIDGVAHWLIKFNHPT